MKRFLFCSLLALSLASQAQDIKEGDTLREVTVQAAKVVSRVDGQTIYPTRQQLDHSPNGYSLLSKLPLPHLRVNPALHTITALSNLGSVQVRINDIVATTEDLLALDMKAVKQVDYIDNPGVRYGEGTAYVVNIVVGRPVSGYVFGTDLTNALTTASGSETVYGKFNKGKSEFGVTYSIDYRDFNGSEYDEQATYEMEAGTQQNASRRQLQGREKSLGHNIQLSYCLSDSNYVFQSKLSARRDIRPHRSLSVFETYENRSSSHTSSPVLDLYWHCELNRRQSLTANAVATYIKTANRDELGEGGSYAYDVAGKTYSLWVESVYENRLKPFTLSLGMQYGQRYINNVYVGDVDASNSMRSASLYFFGQLKGHLGKLGYMGGLGMSSRYYRQGTFHNRLLLFRPKLTLSYPLSANLKLKYDFEVSQHVSQIALVSQVAIKQNAMETLVGNPEIKPNRVTSHDFRLTYSTPRLTAELQGYWRLNDDCNMEKYTRVDGRFYKTQTNARNECSFFFVQNYDKWDIIPEKLSATVYGGLWRFFNFTDEYRHTYTAFNGGASIEAYLGRLTVTAYADNGWSFMEGEHRGHQAAAWYLTASYRLKNIALSLYLQQPFSAQPLSYRSEVVSRYLQKEVTQRSRDLGNMLTLNLSWTLSSGRKYRDIRRTMNHQDTETGILQNK